MLNVSKIQIICQKIKLNTKLTIPTMPYKEIMEMQPTTYRNQRCIEIARVQQLMRRREN